MGRPQQFLCKNRDGNCPNYVQSTVVTVGGAEKFACPLGIMNCERDHLEPIAPPEPPWIRFLKRFALVAVPFLCAGLVWLIIVTRPPPPYIIDVTYTSPPGAKIHPGDTLSWKLSIEGGKPSAKPPVSFDSLSPSLLSKTDLKLESEDESGRKFKLTARTSAGKVGQAKIVVFAGQKDKSQVTNNLGFEIVLLGPPTLALPSAQSLVMESGQDSLALPFVVSDENIDAEKLTFSATADPTDKVACNVQASGSSRTVTLTRNQRESGIVKLAARLVTPDGRETNQTYDVTIIPPPPPTLAINLTSTTPPAESVHPSDEMAWVFTVEGGAASEKPVVVADSLSPSLLPRSALQLIPIDQTSRNFKLLARPTGDATGHVEIRISASLDGAVKDAVLGFEIVAAPSPWRPIVNDIVKFARRGMGRDVIVNFARPQLNPSPLTATEIEFLRPQLSPEILESLARIPEPEVPQPPPPERFAELMKKANETLLRRDYSASLGFLNQALELRPRSVEALTKRGNLYVHFKRYDEASEGAVQALQIEPQYPDAWLLKGVAEHNLGRKRDAWKSYKRYHELAPSGPLRDDIERRMQELEKELNFK